MARHLLIILVIILFGSCVSHQELLNFNEGPDFPVQPQDVPEPPALRIQPDDALFINIHALDQELAAPFNLAPLNTTSQGGTATAANFLVDSEGYIEMPVVGAFHVGGLTIPEARDSLRRSLEPFLQGPIVTIRFTQFRFTVLGEVKTPTTFTLPEEKITILEALGMAGDLTNYGNRTNILVVREENGQRSYGHINLHDRNVFQSPFFYLRPNDVIYVEPLKQKTGSISDQAAKVLPWISAGTVLLNLIIILSRQR
ncbi:MAG: polysaccharide biosynthesis/export family protein [Phaeodactylibacter sp.]|nr:polysaccharide biosynthesis/export family protein [Phaeodactylibacter sp.]MCB9276537.1 polysaccharide biosynthesis/export family protein [Lewinellaceae bacterium]